MSLLRISNYTMYCERFFSTVGNNVEDVTKSIRAVLLPWNNFHGEDSLKEFATEAGYTRWHYRDHGDFINVVKVHMPVSARKDTSVILNMRRGFILYAWRHIAYDVFIAACEYEKTTVDAPGWWSVEVEYLRTCFTCTKPPRVMDVFFSNRISVDVKTLVIFWWIHMCYLYAGDFFNLEVSLLTFLARQIVVSRDSEAFVLLRGPDAVPLVRIKNKPSKLTKKPTGVGQRTTTWLDVNPDYHEQNDCKRRDRTRLQIGTVQWLEERTDRICWCAAAFVLGYFYAPEFRHSVFWETQLSWMDTPGVARVQ